MKILIRNSDNVVIYAQDDINLTAPGTFGDGWQDYNFTTFNATLDDVDLLPPLWSGAVWTYISGSWAIADQIRYNQILTEFKSTEIAKAYANCKAILDEQSAGYSSVEIAAWPVMQTEVIGYNSSNTVGPTMQAIIARGRHTAESLSAMLTPKIAAQNAALQERDSRVELITGLSDPTAVAEYLATV